MSRASYFVFSVLFGFAVLVSVAAFLPRSSGSYTNAIEKFIVLRSDWDVAWGAWVGSQLLCVAVYALLAGCNAFRDSAFRDSTSRDAQPALAQDGIRTGAPVVES